MEDQLKDVGKVSVLASTDAGDDPAFLNEALEAIFAQSVPPDQLVLVIEGLVGSKNELVVAEYKDDPRISAVNIVRLTNKDFGSAMNVGLAACKGEWVMRMDSWCRSRRDRLSTHLAYIREHPNIDVFSSWCEEVLSRGPGLMLRSPVIQHGAVVKALRWHNVIIPGSSLVRASTLRQIGGYRTGSQEVAEYDLYVRLALVGARFRVIPTALIGALARGRAGERLSVVDEIQHRFFCLRAGFLSIPQFLTLIFFGTMFRMAQTSMCRVRWLFAQVRDTRTKQPPVIPLMPESS
jgi:hypothetical protein